MAALSGITGSSRLQTILLIGVFAAAGHGLLWAGAERIFKWKHGEGPRGKLPEGWSAIVLSLSMTIPLVALPPLYGLLAHTDVVQHGHWLASACAIIASSFAHLAAYGSERFGIIGLKRRIFPRASKSMKRALGMEVVWAILHFGSIVLVYRSAVLALSAHEPIVVPSLVSCFAWLLGGFTFYAIELKRAIDDPAAIEHRRVLMALMLMITLQGGMLM